MDSRRTGWWWVVPLLAALAVAAPAHAQSSSIRVQCPSSTLMHPNGAALAPDGSRVVCDHLTAGDGFVQMADGKTQYTFGFNRLPLSVTDPNAIMEAGTLAANFPAPTITVNEGDELFLNVTNVGMVLRPDLSDPHSVHWHGYPNAAAVFDGVPESSIVIGMGATFTYYYTAPDPGTYMYHCHVEATEHMQMGMLGSLFVRPRQDRCHRPAVAATTVCPPGHVNGRRYAYNDGDGSTRYDREFAVQLSSFDPTFHDASFGVQALPFADMKDRYFMMNGRGYPDTVLGNNAIPAPAVDPNGDPFDFPTKQSQFHTSRIVGSPGEKILLRLSNLSVTQYSTVASLGIPMLVVGRDARLLRGDDGVNQYYLTNSVTLGGGESADVILDLTGTTASQRYFLYTTNLHRLANDQENRGGQMTEIRVQ
jgi:FtsP/CotA-like multicopper oxidase with cupredoxin domain